MKSRIVLLPDPVDEIIVAEANLRGVDPAALCSGIITEHCLAAGHKSEGENRSQCMPIETEQKAFDVDRDFSNFPQGSRELAKQFVDAVLEIKGTIPFATTAGVGFQPNFVWIERIKTQRDGVTLSFYGRPSLHENNRLLRKSRANWSRAYVYTADELRQLIPEIQRSYALKRGHRG